MNDLVQLPYPTTGKLLGLAELKARKSDIITVLPQIAKLPKSTLIDVNGTYITVVIPELTQDTLRRVLNACFISLQIVNALRAESMNFGYTYYVYNTDRIYILRETIPGVSLADAIRTHSLDQITSVLLQCIFSLRLAYTRYRFAHNDMNTGNVIVHQLHSPTTLTYREASLRATHLAKIIDFEYSSVSSTDHELTDVYVLVMQVALESYDIQRMDIFNMCRSIIQYFTSASFEDEIELYREGGGFTPSAYDQLPQLNYDSFVNYVSKLLLV